MESKWWFPALALWRLLIATFLVQTFFVPDEFFQSVEVVHQFWNVDPREAERELTWEWHRALRSPLHPLLYAIWMKFLRLLSLNVDFYFGARLLQGFLAVWADWATVSLYRRLGINSSSQRTMIFILFIYWFHIFASTRTLANTLEMVLTVVALQYWPWDYISSVDTHRKAFLWAAIGVCFRPTALLIWLPLFLLWTVGLWKLSFREKGKHQVRLRRYWLQVVWDALWIGISVLMLSITLDCWWYERWTVVPWNFLRFNVLEGIASFYGGHPWHWYWSQGVPLLMMTLLPLFLFGMRREWSNPAPQNQAFHRPRWLVPLWLLIVISLYSLLGHKEYRFLYGIVPIMLILSTHALNSLSQRWQRYWLFFLALTQLPFGLYMSMVHQRGVVDVMYWLRDHQAPNERVSFWMPCHSTPLYSITNANPNSYQVIHCEPPLGLSLQQRAVYLDESDIFYQDPLKWINEHVDSKTSKVVLFEALLPVVKQWLHTHHYQECARFWNAHFMDDDRRAGHVLVYCLNQHNNVAVE